jgi:Skp family chaperone for outer membrane proteins
LERLSKKQLDMKQHWEKLGWPLAAVFGGMLVLSGFQGATTKFGVVDRQKAILTCDLQAKSADMFQIEYKRRAELIEFVRTYPVMTEANAKRLRDLFLKTSPTANETAELNRLKNEAMDGQKKYDALSTKTGISGAEKQQLDELGRRAGLISRLLQEWSGQLSDELNQLQTKYGNDIADKVNASIADVGKNQQFTIVFDKVVAPYGGNEVTDAVVKATNKK